MENISRKVIITIVFILLSVLDSSVPLFGLSRGISFALIFFIFNLGTIDLDLSFIWGLINDLVQTKSYLGVFSLAFLIIYLFNKYLGNALPTPLMRGIYYLVSLTAYSFLMGFFSINILLNALGFYVFVYLAIYVRNSVG